MSPDEGRALERAIADLQRTTETGFATVRGDINLLARGEALNVAETQKLVVRVAALEDRRFPLPTIGGLMGVLAVGVSVVTALSGR